MPAKPAGASAPRPAAPAERAHQADEGSGLRQVLQVQPPVQRARGAGVPARRVERSGFL